MQETHSNEGRWAFVVSGIIAVRVASAALLFYTFISDLRIWAIAIFLFACLTDALDGRLTRRMGAASCFGAYADATADFLLVLAAFSAFVIKRMLPPWTLLLICAMFTQFVVTSGLKRPLYDSIGKYYGVFLFVAIGVTLVLPNPDVHTAMLVGVVGFTMSSLASRSLFLFRRWKRPARPS